MELEYGFLFSTGAIHRHADRNDQGVTRVIGFGLCRIEFVSGGEVESARDNGYAFGHGMGMHADFRICRQLQAQSEGLGGFQVTFNHRNHRAGPHRRRSCPLEFGWGGGNQTRSLGMDGRCQEGCAEQGQRNSDSFVGAHHGFLVLGGCGCIAAEVNIASTHRINDHGSRMLERGYNQSEQPYNPMVWSVSCTLDGLSAAIPLSFDSCLPS
ncbi:hypothetical protein D3C71_1594950 [compost metagenome]